MGLTPIARTNQPGTAPNGGLSTTGAARACASPIRRMRRCRLPLNEATSSSTPSDGSAAFCSRSTAFSTVCRPTRKAERISVRTEREALTHAVAPPNTRLTTTAQPTRPIRRNRSDIGALRSIDRVDPATMPRPNRAAYRPEEVFPSTAGRFLGKIGKTPGCVLGLNDLQRRAMLGGQMADLRQILSGAALVLVLSGVSAGAQDHSVGEALPELTLPTVDVVGATPLLGSGVDRNKVPAETHVLTDQDISRNGYPQALRALNENIPGVTLDAAAGNPFQPNLVYHGFLASPLQGNPQGLAVYLNGARFNQPFGDTVNWDLIPDLAVDRMDLVGSNPVFGLNALGGALSVRMKNGFTYQGDELDLLGGSFAHYQGNLQYGIQSGNTAAYIAASGLHEGGWRDLQSSNIGNLYGDLGWRGYGGEVHVNVSAAQNRLNGPGTAPVELLAVDPAAQFTAPNLITNQYAHLNLTGSYDITDTTSLQGLAYYTYFQQKVANGNVPDAAPCVDPDQLGFLCVTNGVLATGLTGSPIPDFLNGGPYSDLDQQSTNTNGYGVSLQATNRNELFGRPNQLIAGFSFDGAQTLFGASTQIGGLSLSDRVFAGPGITIDQADGSIAPVRVGVSDAYYGAFFTDTLDFTSQLSGNVAGRYNLAQIDLSDQLGSALTGNHTYSRFNPAGGLTYKILPGLTVYASYADANRAPTPAELTCSSAASPCSLANFFTGDPNLQQVVSHTIEAGLRSQFHPSESATVSANIAYYRSTLNNDILFVNSPIQGRAFFQN